MRFLLLAIVCALPAFASQPLKPVAVADKVADRFTPAPYTGQRVEGLLGERMRVNLEGRLLHVDEKGILKGFQQRPGEQDWIGEHAGKFLHAATNTWLYTGDERLKALMDRVVRALLQTQLPDGYLGTYLDEERWTS
ncbi:MAG: beta-L-arabinofuranosidase domain-containing protein, partial [Terriglobia bacterium]